MSPLARLLRLVPDRTFRVVGLLFFLGVVGWRLASLDPRWPDVLLWGAETLIFVLIAQAYQRRSAPYERASTWAEVLLPLVAGPLPFALLATPLQPLVDWRIAFALLLAGDVLALVSYAFLGASFSILVEARPLRERGPYRVIRHPVYVGQALATLGVTLLRFSWRNVALEALFLALQVTRAVLEERKLAARTPGYAEYRARTWRFVPFVV